MNEHILRLYESPVDSKLFEKTQLGDLPMLVLGFYINNLYDHERIKFKQHIDYISISHQCLNDKALLKGICIKPNKTGKQFLTELNTFPNTDTFEKYNISCSDNYMYHRNGLYIIDTNCINIVSDYNIDPRQMLHPNTELPWFSNFADLKLFCLTNII